MTRYVLVNETKFDTDVVPFESTHCLKEFMDGGETSNEDLCRFIAYALDIDICEASFKAREQRLYILDANKPEHVDMYDHLGD